MQFVLALLVDVDVVVVDVFVNLLDDELNRFERKTERPKDACLEASSDFIYGM